MELCPEHEEESLLHYTLWCALSSVNFLQLQIRKISNSMTRTFMYFHHTLTIYDLSRVQMFNLIRIIDENFSLCFWDNGDKYFWQIRVIFYWNPYKKSNIGFNSNIGLQNLGRLLLNYKWSFNQLGQKGSILLCQMMCRYWCTFCIAIVMILLIVHSLSIHESKKEP